MSFSSNSRVVFLLLSCLCCLLGIALLVVCLFSADYRWVGDPEIMRGRRSYGLIRYCFEPEDQVTAQSDDSNAAVCYLRTRAPREEQPINYKQHYAPFEMTTLILLCCAIVAGLAAICFAICTIFTKFGAFAHSTSVLASALCAISGFAVYSYFNELREHQTEKISGNIYMYHYGWAYYVTGVAAAILLIGFVFSLLGSAFVVVHANHRNQNKVESIAL